MSYSYSVKCNLVAAPFGMVEDDTNSSFPPVALKVGLSCYDRSVTVGWGQCKSWCSRRGDKTTAALMVLALGGPAGLRQGVVSSGFLWDTLYLDMKEPTRRISFSVQRPNLASTFYRTRSLILIKLASLCQLRRSFYSSSCERKAGCAHTPVTRCLSYVSW